MSKFTIEESYCVKGSIEYWNSKGVAKAHRIDNNNQREYWIGNTGTGVQFIMKRGPSDLTWVHVESGSMMSSVTKESALKSSVKGLLTYIKEVNTYLEEKSIDPALATTKDARKSLNRAETTQSVGKANKYMEHGTPCYCPSCTAPGYRDTTSGKDPEYKLAWVNWNDSDEHWECAECYDKQI